MIAMIVVAFIRAAATKHVRGTRQFWLYGAKSGDRILDDYSAARRICFP